MATSPGTLTGDGKNLLGRKVRAVETRRRLGEGAVSATITAQHGQGYEHLGRVGDPLPVVLVTHLSCGCQQLLITQIKWPGHTGIRHVVTLPLGPRR